MQYREFPPSPALRRFVECFWTISSEGQPAPTETGQVLPDGSLELVLNFADPVLRSRGQTQEPAESGRLTNLIVGQLPTVHNLRYMGRVDLVAARFRPSGAYSLFGLPLERLTGQVVGLSEILERVERRVFRELDESSTVPERIQALERHLLRAFGRGPLPDPAAEAAVTRIQATAGRVTVSQLMAEIGVSGRRLERLFQREVGIRPKLLCRILRFRETFEAASRCASVDWSGLAAQHGYYDQAHLIRDFREFAGAAPTQLFSQASDPSPIS